MADSTISNLTAGVQPIDADYFVTVQGGVTVKVTAKQLANYAAVAQFSGSSTVYPGDFSNATLALRTVFKSSTLNGVTFVSTVPNGVGTQAGWDAYNSVTPTNAPFVRMFINGTVAGIISSAAGAGTALPLTFQAGASEAARILTSGIVLINQTAVSGASTAKLQMTGDMLVNGNSTVTLNTSAGTFQGTYLGDNRNRFINSDMAIDTLHEGLSQVITAGAALAYTVDRFYAYCTGANVTGQRIASGNRFLYRFTGLAGNTGVGFAQRARSENTSDLAGTTATLMVKQSSTSLTTITWTAYYATTSNAFGPLAAPTRTQIATGTFTINTVDAYYTAQIAVPAAATTGIEVVLSTGPLLAAQTWRITDFGLLPGSSAETVFPRRLAEIEQILCAAYTQKSFLAGTVPAQNVGILTGEYCFRAFQAGALQAGPPALTFPLPFWGVPSLTLYNPAAANAQVRDESGVVDCSGTTAGNISQKGFFFLSVTGNAATIVGNRLGIHWLGQVEL